MNLLAFHAANIGSPLDNRQRISPDSGITVSRLELNLRRPHRSMAAEVIGFRIRVWEGFLASWVTPAAGAEHDRLAGLLSASTAPASAGFSRPCRAARRRGVGRAAGRAAFLALEFRLSP